MFGEVLTSAAFNDAYSQLQTMQSDVTRYAPALSNNWGYLAKQGAAIWNGQASPMGQDQFAAAVASLKARLEPAIRSSMSTAPNVVTNPTNDFWTALTQGTSDAMSNIGTDVAQGAGAAAQNLSTLPPLLAGIAPYVPWIVVGVVALVLVPPLLRTLSGK